MEEAFKSDYEKVRDFNTSHVGEVKKELGVQGVLLSPV